MVCEMNALNADRLSIRGIYEEKSKDVRGIARASELSEVGFVAFAYALRTKTDLSAMAPKPSTLQSIL